MPTSNRDMMFSDDIVVDEIPPLRVSAYVSLVFGLLGFLVFLGWPACVFPVLGVCFGLVALRPSSIPFAGRRVAIFSLGLSVLLGSLGIVYHSQSRSRRIALVADYVQSWLDTFNYPYPEFTYELTLTEDFRRLGEVDLRELYKHQQISTGPDEAGINPSHSFETFLKNEVVAALLQSEQPSDWKFVELISDIHDYQSELIEMRFADASGVIEKDVSIIMKRDRLEDLSRWRISHMEFYKPIR